MIVGPASRRPIRALVDPHRAARQSDAALVCSATSFRVFPTNTCVIADLGKTRVPGILGHDPQNSRLTNTVPNRSPRQTTSLPTVSGQERKTAPHRGAGHAIVLEPPSGSAPRPAQWRLPGSPGERDAVCSPGYEAGHRRAIGVVAALSSTHERTRRWCDAGPPGRQSSRRTRRPVLRACSGTTAATGTGAVFVSMGD